MALGYSRLSDNGKIMLKLYGRQKLAGDFGSGGCWLDMVAQFNRYKKAVSNHCFFVLVRLMINKVFKEHIKSYFINSHEKKKEKKSEYSFPLSSYNKNFPKCDLDLILFLGHIMNGFY